MKRLIAACIATLPCVAVAAELAPYRVVGDRIEAPLAGLRGDAERGRTLALDRAAAQCVLCHELPGAQERVMGNLGPPLAGVGARLSRAQLRLRVVDSSRVSRDTLMPSYYRIADLSRVEDRYRDRPLLDAQQIEDIVAYLATLREPQP